MERDVSARWFRLGVAGATAAVAAFLLARLHAWPPHEDETLALFVGQKPLGEMLDTVLDVRGGAPLHFFVVHVVAAVSPTLTALRLVSVAFAVASIPVVAVLVGRLTTRATALAATALVAASWVTLFHGIYGRMYSLFLCTSALAFYLLLRAVDDNRRSSWALWALAALATVAAHQYGLFVLAAGAGYVLVARLRGAGRLMPAALAFAFVVLAAIPLWRSTFVLASRFDVGVGSSDAGGQLGGPLAVLEYLRSSIGDFVAGWTALFAAVALLAVIGLVVLARTRPPAAILAGCVFAAPAAGLMLAHAGGTAAAPETRHLIFALPFFAMLVAAGLGRIVACAGARAQPALGLAVAALVAAEVAWGWGTTPTLYAGEPAKRREAREAAEAWLARTSRADDVLFGYDPLYLGARERGGAIGETVVPRADPKLALDALLRVPAPLGRGVWVLDQSDGSRVVSNWSASLDDQDRPSLGPGFEVRIFGPFLVVRTREPTVTPAAFLRDTLEVQRTKLDDGFKEDGSRFWYWQIANAGINSWTATLALRELGRQPLEASQRPPRQESGS